jgi:hypothetical protein
VLLDVATAVAGRGASHPRLPASHLGLVAVATAVALELSADRSCRARQTPGDLCLALARPRALLWSRGRMPASSYSATASLLSHFKPETITLRQVVHSLRSLSAPNMNVPCQTSLPYCVCMLTGICSIG